jgi:hypothetical protein
MARADLLNILYSKEKSPLEFNFDTMWCIPMYNMIPQYAIEKLYNVATSIRYASKVEKKYDMVKQILEPLSFKKFHSGTNRVIYRHLECTDIVAKIAIDRVGMQDNPLEFQNQVYLKPFVTKTFEISTCGTVGIAERVEPITSRLEFESVGESIYDLLTQNIIGEYVLQDIGTKFFRNWGLRKGFGPVLLDYPYMFKLDGNRLFCNKEMDLMGTQLCGGQIDYDAGFNNLICKKCGKTYQARDLQKYIEKNQINFKDEEMDNMKVELRRGNKVVYSAGDINETSVPRKNKRNSNPNYDYNECKIQAHVVGGRQCSENIVNVGATNQEFANQMEALKNIVPEDMLKVIMNSPAAMAELSKSMNQTPIETKAEKSLSEQDKFLNKMISHAEKASEVSDRVVNDMNDGFSDNIKLDTSSFKGSATVTRAPQTSHFPINTESNIDLEEVKEDGSDEPTFNTQSKFMTPKQELEVTEEEKKALAMSDALGVPEDEIKEEKEDITDDSYINNKYGDLYDEDEENFERIVKRQKPDVSKF